MEIRKMSLEDLELLSYSDIAYELLKSDKKQMTTPELFGEVCKLLEISEDNMYEMISDFYTTLTTDKRFIFVGTKWDLKELHSVKPILDEDEDDEEELEEENNLEDETEDSYDVVDDDIDDLDDLAIVTEEEIEE